MTKVNVHEAKTNLSKLIEKAKNGEEIVIAKNGIPEARLVPYEEPRKNWFGMDAGRAWISDDFNELDDDILELMSDPKIFLDEVNEKD